MKRIIAFCMLMSCGGDHFTEDYPGLSGLILLLLGAGIIYSIVLIIITIYKKIIDLLIIQDIHKQIKSLLKKDE